MAHHPHKTMKKLQIIKQIFKWFGLVLLSLLLITAIFFQAPWKVTALLIIILLACTVLPKPFRKWFWSLVGVAIITLIIWVLLPEKQDDWKPYTFDNELAALEARYAIPENENAAVIYQQLLDSNYDINEPNDCDLLNKSLSSKDYPQIALWLYDRKPVIEKLIEASKSEKCHFPIVADMFELAQTMYRLPSIRHWAKLLIAAANNDLGDGHVEQALEKAHAVLQIAKHQYQQPIITDTLVGITIEALGISWLDNFIITQNPTDENLKIIEQWLRETRFNWNSNWPAIIAIEKLLCKNTLSSLYYAINSKGEIRFNHNPMTVIKTPPNVSPKLNYWKKKSFKLYTVLYWFYMPSTPQKAGEIIDVSYEKYYAMAKPDFDWKKEPKEIPTSLFFSKIRLNYRYMTEFMADMLEAGHYKIHDIYLRYTIDQKGSLIIIALKRYKNEFGNWPENLNKIKSLAPAEIFMDSLNGGSFVYKITDDDFTLYSKGKNNIDENGKRDTKNNGADDWLIWPMTSCKNKKGES